MHPIMSDLDVSVRTYERELDLYRAEARHLANRVARERGLPNLATRFRHALWQFVDPRGYALAQVRSMASSVTPTVNTEPAPETTTVLAAIETLPVSTAQDRPAWRHAA